MLKNSISYRQYNGSSNALHRLLSYFGPSMHTLAQVTKQSVVNNYQWQPLIIADGSS